MVSFESSFERGTDFLNRNFKKCLFACISIFIFALLALSFLSLLQPDTVQRLYQCAVPSMIYVPPMINEAISIQHEEFNNRRRRLSAALREDKLDALIMEPTVSMDYFANITTGSWGLSERPFLGIIFSDDEPYPGDVASRIYFLVPKFELPRAKELVGKNIDAKYITWDEDENPYQVLYDRLGPLKLMIDGTVRNFIAQGLQYAGFTTFGVSPRVASLREIKSPAEVDIMSRVNIATVAAIRSVQPCIKPGITEKELAEVINMLFVYGGLPVQESPIVLFGERAAMPHGGPSNRRLKKSEFVLMDVGTTLFGYHSDCTRTVLPHGQKMTERMEKLWNLVYDAQTAGIQMLSHLSNTSCAEVDLAARKVIKDAGYGEYFIHRLGHGLGLEEHEQTYLNPANKGTPVQKGNVFTVEPGIYIPDEIGIRIEDAVLASDVPILLTNFRAKSPYEP
ncbi:X-Pro dipeptidase [Schizosaccharomyces pombe]|uniref:Uncharacterized peptidase C18A7.01 n=1 Tax=Schizosaccharomyces pombe (strain 972 / ATCC 24843) TaxID=284812 RepID=YOD1_SCHPO|nr:putative X-Pro dipeptidase [Schizosaccharomyces pombe]Q9UUD8.1 RecName: Full=Uncharacterized peptidase C18A7.01 [Schizosaccharomyces pombe 972h-]CAA20739.3 X-Pro dipeptidase (predicted) [Schizosaccharomyces pombe]|eukprot:NP_596119.2 putative X-Pro dipeptidase [Schizosaccharomyces pombe]